MQIVRLLRRAALPLAVLLSSAALISSANLMRVSSRPSGPAQIITADPSTASPLYPSSVVGTDFDFITEGDPTMFDRLEYIGFQPFEMPDKRGGDKALVQNAYVFDAYFADQTKVSIALDAKFGDRMRAQQDAMRYVPRVGKLPSIYRRNLKHIVVHAGGADTTAFAEDQGHFFVIYSDNATRRIQTHDLEETLFHEATHASIQVDYLNGAAWKNATTRDGAHVTDYAKTESQEDFAESALFAYIIINHPERLPAAERAKIERQIPHRIAFFRNVYSSQ